VGCLSTANGEDEEEYEIRFEEQKSDSSNLGSERVVIRNVSGTTKSLTAFTLDYSSGYKYTFEQLSLETSSSVAIVSQGKGNSVVEADPPTYYRDADLPELVLEDGKETVELRDRDDEVVVTATYEGS
jgi:hypothetical protein